MKLGTGAWSWFADPRAVYGNGRTYAGWVSPEGDQVVGSWTPSVRTRTVLFRDSKVDDHDAPALAVLADGRVMAFSSTHNGRQMRWRLSARAADVSSWSPLRIMNTNTPGRRGYTYPNPVRLPGEGNRLYLFWRGGDWSPAFSTFRPDGSWAPARRLLKPRVAGDKVRPYVKYASRGDTIAFAFTDGHPRNERRNSVHVALYRHGRFYRANGKRIGTLGRPLDPRRADLVYAAGNGRPKAWLHDVAINARGNPVVVYATFPRKRSHRYRYAVWRRGRWRDRQIVRAGTPIGDPRVSKEVYYSGGISLNPADPSVAYLSRTVHGVHELERWRTPDGGRHWRHRAVTASSARENLRPVVPHHLPPGQRQVLWLTGRYRTYHRFSTSVMLTSPLGSPPEAAFRILGPARDLRGQAVTFDTAGTHAGTAPIVSGRWNFGDGSTAPWTGSIRHVYPGDGDYFPTLELTDASGRRDVLTRELMIR